MSQQIRSERLERRLAYYTIAASAGMLATSAAAAPTNADITVSVTAEEGGFEFEEFDVDSDSVQDFQLQVSLSAGDGYGGYCGSVVLSSNNSSGWTAYAEPIAPGALVDESFLYTNYDQLYQGCSSQDPGLFGLNEGGFIGFRIPAGGSGFGDSGSSWHYGYMDVEIEDGSLTGTINAVWFESTPDTPIRVPAPFQEVRSVPVGGALPLGLLLFAAGAAALRRRNRAVA